MCARVPPGQARRERSARHLCNISSLLRQPKTNCSCFALEAGRGREGEAKRGGSPEKRACFSLDSASDTAAPKPAVPASLRPFGVPRNESGIAGPRAQLSAALRSLTARIPSCRSREPPSSCFMVPFSPQLTAAGKRCAQRRGLPSDSGRPCCAGEIPGAAMKILPGRKSEHKHRSGCPGARGICTSPRPSAARVTWKRCSYGHQGSLIPSRPTGPSTVSYWVEAGEAQRASPHPPSPLSFLRIGHRG